MRPGNTHPSNGKVQFLLNAADIVKGAPQDGETNKKELVVGKAKRNNQELGKHSIIHCAPAAVPANTTKQATALTVERGQESQGTGSPSTPLALVPRGSKAKYIPEANIKDPLNRRNTGGSSFDDSVMFVPSPNGIATSKAGTPTLHASNWHVPTLRAPRASNRVHAGHNWSTGSFMLSPPNIPAIETTDQNQGRAKYSPLLPETFRGVKSGYKMNFARSPNHQDSYEAIPAVNDGVRHQGEACRPLSSNQAIITAYCRNTPPFGGNIITYGGAQRIARSGCTDTTVSPRTHKGTYTSSSSSSPVAIPYKRDRRDKGDTPIVENNASYAMKRRVEADLLESKIKFSHLFSGINRHHESHRICGRVGFASGLSQTDSNPASLNTKAGAKVQDERKPRSPANLDHSRKRCHDGNSNTSICNSSSASSSSWSDYERVDDQEERKQKRIRYALSVLGNPNKHETDAIITRAVREAQIMRSQSIFSSLVSCYSNPERAPACHNEKLDPTNVNSPANTVTVTNAPACSLGDRDIKKLSSGSRAYGRKRIKTNFPRRLMHILSRDDTKHAISWLPDGRAFVVLNPAALGSNVLPQFFKGTKFESFDRRLKRWNFERVKHWDKTCFVYRHKLFLREDPDLSLSMKTARKQEQESNPQIDTLPEPRLK